MDKVLVLAALVSLMGATAAFAQNTPATVISAPTQDQLAPFYPSRDRALHLGGTSIVRCKVSANGTLSICAIVKAAGPGFGPAALKSVKYFKVQPATQAGFPVEGTIDLSETWSPPN